MAFGLTAPVDGNSPQASTVPPATSISLASLLAIASANELKFFTTFSRPMFRAASTSVNCRQLRGSILTRGRIAGAASNSLRSGLAEATRPRRSTLPGLSSTIRPPGAPGRKCLISESGACRAATTNSRSSSAVAHMEAIADARTRAANPSERQHTEIVLSNAKIPLVGTPGPMGRSSSLKEAPPRTLCHRRPRPGTRGRHSQKMASRSLPSVQQWNSLPEH